jgi:hypothetical protein
MTPSDLPTTELKNTARDAGGAPRGARVSKRRPPFLADDLPEALQHGAKPARKKVHTVTAKASEHQIQCAVARYLDLALTGVPNCIWWAVPNGGWRDPRTAKKLKAEGVKPGVSDIMVLWGGRLICIEMKAAKGAQSNDQKAWADDATCAGAAYFVARSVEQVEEFLDAAGVPLRARTRTAVGGASAE